MARFEKGRATSGRHRCKKCGKVFPSVQALGGHMGEHKRQTAQAQAQTVGPAPTGPPTQSQTATQTQGPAQAQGTEGEFTWPSWDEMRKKVEGNAPPGTGGPAPAPSGVLPLKVGLGFLIVRVARKLFPDDPLTPDEEAAIDEAFRDLIGFKAEHAPPYIILPFDISPLVALALVFVPRFFNKAAAKKGETGKGGVVSASQAGASPAGPKGA